MGAQGTQNGCGRHGKWGAKAERQLSGTDLEGEKVEQERKLARTQPRRRFLHVQRQQAAHHAQQLALAQAPKCQEACVQECGDEVRVKQSGGAWHTHGTTTQADMSTSLEQTAPFSHQPVPAHPRSPSLSQLAHKDTCSRPEPPKRPTRAHLPPPVHHPRRSMQQKDPERHQPLLEAGTAKSACRRHSRGPRQTST